MPRFIGTPPVKEGEKFQNCEIIGEGARGDGFTKIANYVIFIPDVQKGDVVNIRIKKVKPNCAFAEAI